jgi:hypothetical protein
MNAAETSYNVNLDFEVIKFPLVTDIMIVGKKVFQGKYGILQSFQLISPDVFELLDLPEDIQENIEAVIINKSILKKLPREKILQILCDHVFPFVVKGETLRVDFNVQIIQKNITGEIHDGETPA